MLRAIRSIGMISFFIPWSLGKQSRHLNYGGVEDVEDELRGDADGEHKDGDGHDDEFFALQKIGQRAATLSQWSAKEGLHDAHKNDGRHEKPDHRHSRERGGNRK